MKKCPVCGKEWSDATRFCGSCGAKLEDGNIVVPDIVPDDGKEEQRKKTEPVKPSVKKTIEPVRPKTRETAENKKIAEEKEEESQGRGQVHSGTLQSDDDVDDAPDVPVVRLQHARRHVHLHGRQRPVHRGSGGHLQ